MTTYSESAFGVSITRERAIKEIRNHGITENMPEYADFLDWLGDRPRVMAHKVLEWLGY